MALCLFLQRAAVEAVLSTRLCLVLLCLVFTGAYLLQNQTQNGVGFSADTRLNKNVTFCGEEAAATEVEPLGQCGNWQQDYAALHASILAGKSPPRYAVAHTASGLADALVGTVTIFYLALLTGRAFQVRMEFGASTGNQMEWAFQQPHINWTESQGSEPINSAWYDLDPFSRDNPLVQTFWKGNLTELASDCETIRIGTFYGMTARLFLNPYLREKLLRMGLQPETAFGCAMDFLFGQPVQEVQDIFQAEHGVLRGSEALRIGIQVRTGDDMLYQQPNISSLKPWEEFFNCAKELEKYYRLPGQQVIWLLVSDSLALRAAAKQKYGDKLLVHTGAAEVRHIGDWSDSANNPESKRKAFMAAAGEMWLFSLTNFHVISRLSGYGRVGAFWSKQPNSVYTVRVPAENEPPKEHKKWRKCGPHDYDSLRELAITHVGDWHPGV